MNCVSCCQRTENGCQEQIKDLLHYKPTMTVDETIDFFRSASPSIFQKSCLKSCFDNILCGCVPFPCFSYNQVGLEQKINEKFGENTTLKDFDHIECIAGAVAKQFDKKRGEYVLELFDTKSSISYEVKDVLKASSCAPVFFTTPTKINGVKYIDGGVGGNCPLVQAVPRMNEILLNGIRQKCIPFSSALSIAPPHKSCEFL